MANKMLIDATHSEETRVVVVRGNRVEEFDFESANRKPLRGNIYLAKVTRVEPSLQAAFVDYGGNRHGFLAFSEIHPDYYQIPYSDRQALIEADEAEAREEAEAARAEERAEAERVKSAPVGEAASESGETAADEDGEDGSSEAAAHDGEAGDNLPPAHRNEAEQVEIEDSVESVGAEDALEEVPERRPQRNRRVYKIQEVIKRRQVLLVQVVKEERGNKGAALTTYLSLAGRYSVLMPNTARGGGISRKITSAVDRKRLKKIASDLEVPEGMGVILRTAGANRTKVEVKRDFEYLLRLWESVRELTLKSAAPALVYEEGSLVKRSIRDLYNKDIDEVLVAGDDGYREAKDFMRMLMPSHAKNVKLYRDPSPLFTRFGVEAQLDAMFSPQVTLKSGGYIVINQTEALVSIDVNSGRSTREHNIEDTALQTNLEASDEVARQLRLRDLAGLIVIDFIDMEENKNNRSVERRLKEALKSDRARIQVGRISHFGLMEMSRQRIRTGVVESSTQVCPHCFGTGLVRSTESVALHVLRTLEESLLKSASHNLIVRTRTAVALYILNQKRSHLADVEHRFGVQITIAADESLGTHHLAVERGEPAVRGPNEVPPQLSTSVRVDSIDPDEMEPEVEPDVEDEENEEEARSEAPREREADGDGQGRKRRRRRRRRRGGGEGGQAQSAGSESDGDDDDENGAEDGGSEGGGSDEDGVGEAATEATSGEATAEPAEDDDAGQRRRRRGRRGGRRRREGEGEANGADETDGEVETSVVDLVPLTTDVLGSAEPAAASEPTEDAFAAPETAEVNEATEDSVQVPLTPPWEEAETPAPATEVEAPQVEVSSEVAPVEAPLTPEPAEAATEAAPAETAATETVASAPEATETAEPEAVAAEPAASAASENDNAAPVVSEELAKPQAPVEDEGPKRTGWWQRRSFF
ncbi:Rne/Rng family ribonuclease [Segnochrobactrum spirostomi]|uniref:Ribonuclease E n=1 Tax=Segnochrobactrum spirostomi TaxID=2608987 RepID=A0A6A7Y5S2_9HYPH|nr:ribonuclease E/G [Segnochrobactrum spirostomi]MQT14055.1 ribonuclease E/G [Segnochrobactrum spirostomi]